MDGWNDQEPTPIRDASSPMGLVTANLVEETSLPTAVPEPETSSGEQGRKDYCGPAVALLGLFVVLLVSATLFVYARPSDGSADDASTAESPSQRGASTKHLLT